MHVGGRYATVADFVLARGDYMHLPGSHRPVNFEHHHLVTWRAFVASRWSQHYYGQARGSFINPAARQGQCVLVNAAAPARPVKSHFWVLLRSLSGAAAQFYNARCTLCLLCVL